MCQKTKVSVSKIWSVGNPWYQGAKVSLTGRDIPLWPAVHQTVVRLPSGLAHGRRTLERPGSRPALPGEAGSRPVLAQNQGVSPRASRMGFFAPKNTPLGFSAAKRARFY